MNFTRLAIAGLGAAVGYGLIQRRKDRDLTGKTALITGSSRGLGYLLAREYAREGCRVVICARDTSELDDAQAKLRRQGAQVLAITCDVTDEQQVSAMITETIRQFGTIDILVNNAGIIPVGPLEAQTIDDFEESMASMFYGVLLPTWYALPHMIEQGDGRVVNITSIGARLSFPHLLPYTCAKYAALGLSRGLRAELRRHDISVTTVVPGLMRTGSFVHALFKGQRTGEFSWFALGSSLPGITVSAERAARRIVDASSKRRAEYVVGAPAKVGAVVSGLFPGLVADLMSAVDRWILPRPTSEPEAPLPGELIEAQMEGLGARMVKAGTTLGRRAGRRYNERR